MTARPVEAHLEQVAGAVVLHGDDGPDALAGLVVGAQAGEVGVVELVLSRRRQATRASAYSAVPCSASAPFRSATPATRATTPFGVTRTTLIVELLAAILGRQRAIGADVAGLAGIAVDDHVAADAVRADDTAEKNALSFFGHRQPVDLRPSWEAAPDT